MADGAAPEQDFAQARSHMVDGQVRPNKVSDPRILDAMRRLPRERFVPAALAQFAYIDEDVPLGRGRFLMEPMVVARLVQMLRARPGQSALVVAAGSGYGAALLAACGARVTALEEDEALLSTAGAVLPEAAPGVALVHGPLAAGWPGAAPFDCILVEGAVEDIPAVLGEQLRPGGRCAAVLRQSGGPGRAVLAERSGQTTLLRAVPEFDCNTPMLPSLRPAAAFTF